MRNSRITSLFLGSAAFSLLFANPVAAQTKSTAVTPVDKEAGSRYVQCDGNPNNMTAGESAARLLGAVTLLALFAPPPESPDASKRKFGAEGVAVCSALIDGDAKEGNAKRRIDLILARALHHIEAKDYTAAITDTKLARSEADALGLTADPYFMKSRGYVFANIESAALLRMGQLQEAKNVALSNAELAPYSLSSQRFVNPFSRQVREMTPAEEAFYKRYAKLSAFGPSQFANRLEDNGRFADAAKYRAAIVAFNDGAGAEDNQTPTRPIAAAAISAALAGDWARANTYFNTAKENFEARKVAGKPDEEPSAIIEQFDLYSILERMRDNDMKTARRLFSARSQWTEVSFGNIMEVNRRLRIGAEPDELIGGLEKSPDQLWMDRANNDRAQIIAKDANNKELFWLIPVLNTSSEYEAYSKNTWNTSKSRYIIKEKKADDEPNKNRDTLFSPSIYGSSFSDLDAYLLHGALLAKSRNHNGAVFIPLVKNDVIALVVQTGNCGDNALPVEMCASADEIIQGLQAYIPSPEALKQIKAARSKATKS